jgi:hypothetical protein
MIEDRTIRKIGLTLRNDELIYNYFVQCYYWWLPFFALHLSFASIKVKERKEAKRNKSIIIHRLALKTDTTKFKIP